MRILILGSILATFCFGWLFADEKTKPSKPVVKNQRKTDSQKNNKSEHKAILQLLKRGFFVTPKWSKDLKEKEKYSPKHITWDNDYKLKKGEILRDAASVYYSKGEFEGGVFGGEDFGIDDEDSIPLITNKDLVYLSKLPLLESVHLSGKFQISDDGIRHIRDCTKINYIYLRGHKLTGEGLSCLGKLTELSVFKAHFYKVSDDHLKAIRNLTKIDELRIIGSTDPKETGITDHGIVHLKGMKKLKYIELENSRMTDKGLAVFLNMPQLEELHLENAKNVTDRGLDVFTKIPKLNYLVLKGSSITDAGIGTFFKMKKLESLNIEDTKITDEGVLQLAELKNLGQLYLSRNISLKTVEKLKKEHGGTLNIYQ